MIPAADRDGPGATIEFFHGYTYGGHPAAMAAGADTLSYTTQPLYMWLDYNMPSPPSF